MGVIYVLLLSTLGLAIHTQAQDCPAPVAGEHMMLKDNFNDPQTFKDGTTVSFACDIGYISAGGSASIICTAGTWSPVKLNCERRNCGTAGEVPNGDINYSEGTEFGHKIVVTCNPGYNLVGKNTIYCGVQGWMSRLPVCEVVVCYPPLLGVDVTFRPIKEVYDFQEVVQYNCQKDYTLSGSKSLSCSEDGTFKPAPPTCVKVQCEDSEIKHGIWVKGSRPPHKYKSTVTFECIPGYTMTGAHTQTCEINSQWSPGLPSCQPVQCEDPKIQNADRVEGSQPPYKYKSTVIFKCLSGYTMTGSRTQTCEIDRKWSPGLPSCQLKPTITRPSTTKKTIVDHGPTDAPGNNGNGNAIGLGIGLTVLIGVALTFFGCYFCGVPAIIKEKRRAWRGSPDNVVPKEEVVPLA